MVPEIFLVSRNLDLEKNWVPKNFGSQKIVVPEIFLVPRNVGVEKI